MTRIRKEYKDPHAALKAALAALLFLALSEKRKLILAYVADYGTDGLLDYADTILDAGWDTHFEQAAEILSSAATDSTVEVLDAAKVDFTDAFVANLERHNELIAKNEAARLLGLHYDIAHDVAVPTVDGFTPSDTALEQLGEVIKKTEQQSQFLQQQQESLVSLPIDTAIEDMSLFSGQRAEQMAHNAIAFVSGASARASATALGASLKRSETVGDNKVCPACVADELDGWIAINDEFSGSETADVPHHPNCLTGDTLVLPGGRISSVSKRWFEGEICVVRVAGYAPLEITPNHPVLTLRGWIPAGMLDKFDRVVCGRRYQWIPERMHKNGKNMPARIEDVVESFLGSNHVVSVSVPTAAKDFHNDGLGSKVAIIGADSDFWDTVNPARMEHEPEFSLVDALGNSLVLPGLCSEASLLKRHISSLASTMSSGGHFSDILRGASPDSCNLLLASISQMDTVLSQNAVNSGTTDAIVIRDTLRSYPRAVEVHDLLSVERRNFSGHVYNLECELRYYIGNGIAVHNCRCGVEYEWAENMQGGLKPELEKAA